MLHSGACATGTRLAKWPKRFAGGDLGGCRTLPHAQVPPGGSALSWQILSPNQRDLGSKFPEVNGLIAALDLQDAIIDGEIVHWTKKDRSSFQL